MASATLSGRPQAAITADHNTLYVSESAVAAQLYRFDITTDTPTKTGQGRTARCSSGHSPSMRMRAVYTCRQVGRRLQQMSGEFAASAAHRYVTGGDRLFVSQT
ncbi:MAG: hypothetical protein U0841_14460 [Chloroflexia bacterium]